MGEPEKIQHIIFEFFRKVMQVILESRIHSVLKSSLSSDSYSKPSSSMRDGDKWFNLNLGLIDNAKPAILEPWSKTPTTEPMFVEILLAGSDGASISRPGGQSSRGLILERWTVQYALNASSSALHADMQRSLLYKKAVILLRSLYCTARLLPAYRVYRNLQKSSPSHNTRKLTYRISASPMTLPKGIMGNHNFTPVETQCGKLCLSVSYLANLICRPGSEVDRLDSPMTQLIPDYCGSPGSERRFHGTSRGKHNVLSAPSSPGFRATGFGRCHSWSGGINKILLPSTAPQQSPSRRFSMIPTSPNPNYHGTSINSRTPPLPVAPQRSHSIVDRFASPSPSPPMRSRFSNESVPRGLPRTGSLPQNMDQSRNTLPHHINWTREAYALSRAVSANSKFMAVYSHSALSSTSTSGNSVVPRQAHSGHKDEKDDNVSLRGTLSRGSSRRSYTNEVEDEDLSCLFALDGDESDGYRSSDRADTLDEKLCLQEVMEVPGQTVSTPRRSQNAALGELVEMFKSAPPLQKHIGNALDFSQASADIWWDDSSRENFQCPSKENQCGVPSSSTVYSNCSRASIKTANDGLEELQNYKEIKDCFLRQSGVPEGGTIKG